MTGIDYFLPQSGSNHLAISEVKGGENCKWCSGSREPAPFSSSLKYKKIEYEYFKKSQNTMM
jgi:hypothetical protein